jgi:hypothetical protein
LIFTKGFIFRFGQGMKDLGERMAHKKVWGIPVLRWCCGLVIALGLAVRDSVTNCPVAVFSRENKNIFISLFGPRRTGRRMEGRTG